MEIGVASSHWRADTGNHVGADAALDEIVGRYRETHRRYHGLGHVLRVLTDVADLLAAVPVTDAAAVRLAAWFHDAVYDPRSSTNEEDSALLARRVLAELDVSSARVDESARLILLTADHDTPDPAVDPAAAVLLDADLAVLGSDPATYAAYARGVRAEYAHVDDAGWRSGRAVVLRRFLAAERIFATPPMLARDSRARANLAAELAALERQPA